MNEQVLVDSTVWIAATRQPGDQDAIAELGELLLSGRAAMTEPVWMELYQGIRGKREKARLVDSTNSSVWLEFEDACWSATVILP